jgi:hypothetical protein
MRKEDSFCGYHMMKTPAHRGSHHQSKEKTAMMDQPFSLITLGTYWENYQQRLIATISPLSSEQLALPVASHQTIGELVPT